MDALKALARDKGIDEYDMLDKLENNLAGTYQRILDLENPVRVTLDRETGRIYVYEQIPDPEWEGELERGAHRRRARRYAARRVPHRRPERQGRHHHDHPRR